MLESISAKNLGPIASVDWQPAPGINVVLGDNGSGKTLLLKAIYALVRTREQWQRGQEPRTFRQLLDDKLYWTFQVDRLGALVRKGADGPLALTVSEGPGKSAVQYGFEFGNRASRGVASVEEPPKGSESESIFIPAKEVLSLAAVIKESRSQKKFGFDDPTLDLVEALEREPTRGAPRFGTARPSLEKLVGGRVSLVGGGWVMVRGRDTFPVAITAEGHKKIAIIDRLIMNRVLSPTSMLFIDEPESFLHPEALLAFLRILMEVSDHGVQMFLATHSLVVLNALRLFAESKKKAVGVLSLVGSEKSRTDDLRDGMPDNGIVDASIHLYNLEMQGRFDD